jgi:acetylglutamate kinase
LQDGALISRLTAEEVHRLIQSGVITGGMIPKVQTALHALSLGVSSTVITNLDGLSSRSGTIFLHDSGASNE